MSSGDTKRSLIEVINVVRGRIGFDSVTDLDDDKNSVKLLGFTNAVMDDIQDYGDWQEQYAEVSVTAVGGQAGYELGLINPIQRIYEISFDDDRQNLYRATIEKYNQWQRGGNRGRPRHYTIKGIDTQGNPKFFVHPVPTTAMAGDLFNVVYFKKVPMYDLTSADDEIPFPATLVIQGLYTKALVEEAGGEWTKEAIESNNDYMKMLKAAQARFNADTGTWFQITPQSYGKR